ncbi:WD40 repeat domain-containing protein [Gloeothece verrucosa]|uniref:WD40 repeat, subgroup n=1 Tax=Gloeothece verrucosa (strain PCC 7822) TaxID=497965 RepID=E0UGW0_GLOV7|nr:WD40 repeat domain-containing protein [Gloeothece verrucosa]ADN14441.1 WD40 repeat, subgroup [Gloeothece verrucosa PCC 7822]
MKKGGKGAKNRLALGAAIGIVILNGSILLAKAQIPPLPKKTLPDSQPITPPKEETSPQIESFPSPEQWRLARLVRTLKGQQSTPESLIFTPDGQHLITGGSFTDPQLRVWSFKSGQKLSDIKAQRTGVQALAINPSGTILISGGQDGGINMWDWRSGKYLGIWLEHQGQVMALRVTPDGEILVSGGLDGIRIWTLNPRRPLYRLTGLGHPVYALAISPDGVILASGSLDGEVKFWNIKEGKLLSTFYPHQATITGLVFTPDGKKLITSSQDKTIKVWDLATGQLIYTLAGHTGRIRAIALNPDGKILASGGNDGIRIWNIETGEQYNQIIENYDWVQSLAFSPDGQFLASGSFDFQVKIWQCFPTPILQGPSRVDQLFNQ